MIPKTVRAPGRNVTIVPGIMFGESDLEKLSVSWLETQFQITPDDETVNWKSELCAVKRDMRRALKRAGMYSPSK